jgi:bifunctional non-homologous end joining protein LigD
MENSRKSASATSTKSLSQIGVTKAQFIAYIIKVAPKMLPILNDRPLVLTRYPKGVDKQGFYAKNAPTACPDGLKP